MLTPLDSSPALLGDDTGAEAAKPAVPVAGTGERRDVLAAERTFLAWIRTCLALLAGGTALGSFPLLPHPTARGVLAVVCMVCAGGLAVSACRTWGRVRRAASADPLRPGAGPGRVVTTAVLVVAVALAVPSATRVLDGGPVRGAAGVRHHGGGWWPGR